MVLLKLDSNEKQVKAKEEEVRKESEQSDESINLIEALKEEHKEKQAIQSNNIQTKSVVQGHKHQVDLEVVMNIEQKLWWILDWFTWQNDATTNVYEHCEEWWDLVDSNTLSQVHSVFTNDILRRLLRKSSILELLAITMINFLSSECKSNKDLHGNLKVLIFYIHQNYLILVSWILNKLPPYNNTNIWVRTLKRLIKKKSSSQIQKQSVEETLLQANNVITTLLEHIGKEQRKTLKDIKNEEDIRKATKPIFSTTLNICKYIDRMSIK